MKRIEAWAYLSRTIEGPNRHLQRLLADGREPEAIAQGIARREVWIGHLLAQTQSRYAENRSKEDLAAINAIGGRLVTPDDAEWPREVLDQAFGFAASGYSEHARAQAEDAVAPHALWVKGAHLKELCQQAVAMVGTRAMTQYGKEVIARFAPEFAMHRWTVISGGALGVDTEAHRQALIHGGATIAVAACGLDRHYPARNRELFQHIAKNGALVSEYAPGMAPHRHRFLTRNRLVAALSQGTVVVEAAWRSGALNTLKWAQSLGKVTMAVPGPVHNVASLGCHEKIRQGDAQLVCSGQEVRALLECVGTVDVEGQYELDFAADPIQGLSRNELRVFDALSMEPEDAHSIAGEAGLSAGLTLHLLVTLEQRNVVQRVGAKWIRGTAAGG
ncbi:DNA-processing protein DprA [Corynebacterium gerontici]|uniref:Smf/DprA SLOG domain-containing protein n=1 Tax=Corynebacterium gerontici TaxID=2079234 RepID=A0A3G6J186_9CORY|nr:DNA-processing protein DprA [Corynebacterium gerontici]AZA11686.1 hypothetical protein CGERO_06930 [Corynebacterium gerontici]